MGLRALILPFIFAAGCNPSRHTGQDAAIDGWWGDPDADAWVRPDVPPPTVDAGVPVVACDPNPNGNPHIDAAVQCALPPSRCLDRNYLAYFTGGTCGAEGVCQYDVQLMACDYGCQAWTETTGGCYVPST